MKNLLYVMGLAVVLCSFNAKADTDGIVSALKKASADQLSSYFDNVIDIKLPGKEEIKSVGKNQATLTIKNFFDESKVSGFDITSQREMSGIMYITGKLKGDGKNYNITLLMKNKADKLSIITVRVN
ncbi:DUF4783 domain-containing protein [Foetidibacter luteolus]|uniref:DUF4783 domain-containing protein n=1 Tax=Foetidibacter luteolus TaxID=2608880 RepID=UPI00129B6A1A|nr:DUF4783 domain-containing protein [Foetidibacter luteolus]